MPKRRKRTNSPPSDGVLGGLLGAVAWIAIGLVSAWLLFLWQRPADTGGAILDVAVQYYRPIAWIGLIIAVVLVFGRVAVWFIQRATRRH